MSLINNNWILTGLLATFIIGCGVEVDRPTETQQPSRGTKGEHQYTVDTSLSCANVCDALAFDSQAMTYCGCDEVCATFDDCCGDKSATCDALPPPTPTPGCDYNDPSRQYHGMNSSECLAMFTDECTTGTWFFDECGCGCETIPSAVTLTTDKSSYSIGENIKPTLTNGTTHDVFVEGCSVFWLELQTAAGWELKQGGPICVWEGYAVLISAQDTLVGEGFATTAAGTYRVTTVYGEGCSTTLPMNDTNCSATFDLASAPFTVQ